MLEERAIVRLRTTTFKISIEHLWLGLPVFAVLWKTFLFPLPLLDFWWHLKTGQVIATTGSIPRVDLFSFTAAGKPFIFQNWLAELLYYIVYGAGGFPLLVFFNALMATAAFLFVYHLCLEATDKVRIAAFVAFLAAIGNYSSIRPQTFSFFMFAAYSWVLSGYRFRRRDALWTLPVLMVFWVNLHGAFVLGLGLVAIYIATESCRRLIDPQRRDALTPAELRKLIVMLLLCGLVTLINPETYKVYHYVYTVVTDPASQEFVTEWQPPQVNQVLGILLFYGPFFLGLLSFAYSRIKPDLTEIVLFFGFAVFAMMSTRNAAWFGTVAFPILARYLPIIDLQPLITLRRFRATDWFFRLSEESLSERPVYSRINVVIAVFAVGVLIAQSPWIRPTLYKVPLWDKQTPVGAAAYIHQRGLAGNIFHAQMFGDYLIWRLWPQQRSFIDGRVHLFGLDFVKQYQLLLYGCRWEDLLSRWNIQYLLLHNRTDDEEARKLIESARTSGLWKQVYEDDVTVLFEKVTPSQWR